jgi:hypothetical protein
LLNSANEAAACLVELVNKERDEDFSTIAAMQEYMENKAMNQEKQCADDSSDEEMKKRRCQKKLGQKKMRV